MSESWDQLCTCSEKGPTVSKEPQDGIEDVPDGKKTWQVSEIERPPTIKYPMKQLENVCIHNISEYIMIYSRHYIIARKVWC